MATDRQGGPNQYAFAPAAVPASTSYEGQPMQSPQYYAGAPMAGDTPPSYADFAGMPGPPVGQPVQQMTPIQQSPAIMAQPYYPQGYGQQLSPPVAYAQPYAHPQAYSGQPMYLVDANGQPIMHAHAHVGAPMNAIPLQVAVPASQSTGVWKDTTCDCCNHPSTFCVCAIVCPWLQFAYNLHNAKIMNRWTAILMFVLCWALFWVGFGTYVYLFFVGWALMLCLGTYYRGVVRHKYGINGSCVDDCVVHTFCIPCSLSQEGRHIWNAEGQAPIQYC